MALFGNLFKKKPRLPPIDMAILGTDVHSHFIPGIDDGAATVEESIAMITAMHELGYKKFITTPHVMSDYYRNTPDIIMSGLDTVRSEVKKAGLPVEVDAAAEYYIDFELLELIKNKKVLTFGKNYVLIEMSFMSEPPMLNEVIFELLTNGYHPVMAHVERYMFWHRDFEKFINMKERGALLQLNINSLTGYYSPDVKKMGEQLIEEGMIDLLGSDCHRLEHVHVADSCRTEEYLHKLVNSGNLLNSTL